MNESNLKEEIGNEDLTVLKGDSIGNTAYSERFVLKMMLSLQKIEWNDLYEEELTMFWDMSIDPDVSSYLIEKGFLQIIPTCVQDNFANVRLVEILIGIVGNISCYLSNENWELTNYLLTLMSYDDACTLIQVIRSLRTLLCKHDIPKFIKMLKTHDTFLDRVSEILVSSTKIELLENLLSLINELGNYCESEPNILINNNKLFEALTICISSGVFLELESENMKLYNKVIDLLSTFSSLVNITDKEPITKFILSYLDLDSELEEEIVDNLKDIIINFNLSPEKLLKKLSKASNQSF